MDKSKSSVSLLQLHWDYYSTRATRVYSTVLLLPESVRESVPWDFRAQRHSGACPRTTTWTQNALPLDSFLGDCGTDGHAEEVRTVVSGDEHCD